MLILVRHPQAWAVVIDGTIHVRVLSVEGDRVRLGITAPPDCVVVREELLRSERPCNTDRPLRRHTHG